MGCDDSNRNLVGGERMGEHQAEITERIRVEGITGKEKKQDEKGQRMNDNRNQKRSDGKSRRGE